MKKKVQQVQESINKERKERLAKMQQVEERVKKQTKTFCEEMALMTAAQTVQSVPQCEYNCSLMSNIDTVV